MRLSPGAYQAPLMIFQLGSPNLDGIVLPKVNSAADIRFVHDMIDKHAHPDAKAKLRIVASIESARAVMDIKEVKPADKRADNIG